MRWSTDSRSSGWRSRPAETTERMPAVGRGSYKRPFDLCLVAAALVLLAPLWLAICLVVPLAIRLESPGPVLYRQTRLGRGGREFSVIKFRTMIDGAERRTGPVWAEWRDARVTRVGRLLRRWRLDEAPQLVNVIRGEMSLVGPRPERPALAARFERTAPGFPDRLRVRPGIAGMAQARGPYNLDPRRKLRYDLAYIEAMNPWLDLRLCALCAWRALRGDHRRGKAQEHQNPAPQAKCIVASTGGSNSRAAGSRRRSAAAAPPPTSAAR